ncbi:hypothetical protein CVD27_24560 [Neobacillus cucumis]|uniref:4Fe-4S ferredoxin-type domain-containing protein n=2 Tax=Neobacillus cucumis TaxID=1740721 RepID=A0A2N5H7T8_9BACI|nr:hypothetical protein CVD27_24560 [Neobacillus cucumis]
MSLLISWLECLHTDIKINNACSRKILLRSTCSRCADACRYEALHISSELINIELERCNSCGECIIACPLSAIEGILESREFDKGSLLYSSSFVPSVKELLIYKKRGMDAIKTNSTPLNQNWEDVLQQTNQILDQIDESKIKIINNQEDTYLSRRGFFLSLQKVSLQLVKTMTPALWKIKVNEWKVVRYFPDYQFYQIELDIEKCTFCHMCLTFCSQNVFTIEDGFLQTANDRCVNCSDCTDICSEGAIKVKEEFRKKRITKYKFTTNTCQTCGIEFSTFQPEKEKCSICYNRNPEWLSPFE